MKKVICLLSLMFFFGSMFSQATEKRVKEVNAITKKACAAGYSYVFSVADGILTIEYTTPKKTGKCSAKLSDLKFEWTTLEGDLEKGIDHQVTINCKSGDAACFSGTEDCFFKIRRIEIKGESNAEKLLENLTALQESSK